MTSKLYAPYFLLILTERDTFMRMTDFSIYNAALENTSQFEIELLANSGTEHEEKFMRFLRYTEMLDKSDPKKEEGKKLIALIFNVDKFKAY